MKAILLGALFFIGSTSITHAQTELMDSLSYSLGVLLAQNLKNQGFDSVDAESLASGFSDMVAGTAKVDAKKANSVVQKYLGDKQASQFASIKEAGEKFLAENAQKDSVQVTESGLQYKVLTEGTGPNPSATDKVTVHYHGTLIDGTVFDSSVERGSPTSFPLNQVIAGWTEGVQLMKVGGKTRFFIPYDLAYGSRGAGEKIKPYAALIFDVELISID